MRFINFFLGFVIFSLGVNAQINFSQSELTFDKPSDESINFHAGATSFENDSHDPSIESISVSPSDQDNLFKEPIFKEEINNVLFRINAGGPELTYNGELFLADTNFIGGKVYENTSATVSPLFQTERSANPPTFEYAFNVPNGDYEVILHFAEIFFGATGGGSGGIGKRVFDVDGEGVKLLDDYDIYADVGPQTEVSKTFLVTVTDGELNLVFDAGGSDGVDQPKVAAIEVLSTVQYPLILVDPIANQNNLVGEGIDNLEVVASGGNPSANFNYTISGEPDGIFIDPVNGRIYGTIESTAVIGGPNQDGLHLVTVTISKQGSTPVNVNFNWIIAGPQLPFSMDVITDQQGTVGSNVSLFVNASGGDTAQPISFSISGQPSGLAINTITGEINGIINFAALTGGMSSDGVHLVTVTADRQGSTSAQEQFTWTVATISCAWNDLANSSLEKIEAQSAKVGDKLYVLAGFLSGLKITDTTEIYDTNTDVWSTGAPMPTAVTHMGIAVVGTDIWVVSGFVGNHPGTATSLVQIYDTVLNSWSFGPSLPVPRGSGAVTFNNGKIHYFGGLLPDRVTDTGEHYILDINNQGLGWIPAANLPNPRNHLSAASVKGLVYAIGGQYGHDNGVEDQKFLHVYNPSTDAWTRLADLPSARSHFEPGTIVHNDKIVIVGGRRGSFFFDDVTEYNPTTTIWSERCKLPDKLLAPAAKVFGDRLIVTNGGVNGISNPTNATRWISIEPELNQWFDKDENESYTARHECSFVQAGDKFYLLGGREKAQNIDVYDYTSDTWNSLVNSTPAEFNHFQAVEYEGLIWVIGAFKTNSFPSEAPADYIWAFNPATEEWIQGPEIPSDRKRGSTGLAVYNGKFYILAGNTKGHDGGYVNWFDEYDPATGIWKILTDAPRPRDHFYASVINGKLYAASGRLSGGTGGVFGPVISEVDVYDFATESWSTLPSFQNIPTPRGGAIVANFKNKLVVSGGEIPTNTSALAITEIYDPVSQSWSQGAPLKHQRHGTQGIVSGNGIFVVGGSPNRGGGQQKNMEFYGQDSPVGAASVASSLFANNDVNFAIGETKTISVTNNGGNIGSLLNNMTLSGPDANEFKIDSGDVPFKLIKANDTHNIVISHIGNSFEKYATFTITYNKSDSIVIDLSVLFDGLIFNGTTWIPNAPNETTALDNALIMSGEYTVMSDMEVNNLTVRPSASLIIEAGNSLTTNGEVNVEGDGFIELRSTSTSYASFIPEGTVSGNVAYKRHVNNNEVGTTGSNDLIAPPLSGQAFNNFLSNNSNIVSNSEGTLYLFGPFNKTNGSYDIYASTETASLNAGIGYRTASTDTGTFTFTGTLNTGTISIPISNSGPYFQAWNLIGNPYPSYLDLGAFLSANNSQFSLTSSGIYGYDGDARNGWTVWNQAYADSHPETAISPGQGFFVASQATGGTVNFQPSMRVKGNSDDFIVGRSAQSLPGYLKLSLNQNDKTYHTYFYFNPNASRGLDKGYDAQVWGDNASNFSLHSYLVEDNTGLPMAVQSLGETDHADVQVPLGINANAGEQLRIGISESTLPSTIEVYLEDRAAQSVALLNTGDYVITPSGALNSGGRFFLRFSNSALSSETSIFNNLNVYKDPKNRSVVISGFITEPTKAKLYDLLGREVISRALRLHTGTQNIEVNELEQGVYIISIESATEKMTKKLIVR